MAHRAGVALGRIAENAPFSITRVDGAPSEKHFYPPVEHKLDENTTVGDIMNTVTRLVGFDTTLPDNGFVISYPLAFPEELRAGFKRGRPAFTHFSAFVKGYDFTTIKSEKDDGSFDVLFIDLTPGQVAAHSTSGVVLDGEWFFDSPSRDGQTILGDAGELSSQDVVDKLITPTITSSLHVNLIGIFRPEGPSAEISAVLDAQFPNTTVKWVSLADLSYGAAVAMHREYTSSTEYMCIFNCSILPLGIALANGTTVTALVRGSTLPQSRTVILTNSRDNQTTATLRFLKGTLPCGEITIEGLTEKPKGASRIRVAIEVELFGETVVTVQEVGGTARKVGNIQNVLELTAEDTEAYAAEATVKQVSPTNEGDVIGELPE